jgi:predicted transport protein
LWKIVKEEEIDVRKFHSLILGKYYTHKPRRENNKCLREEAKIRKISLHMFFHDITTREREKKCKFFPHSQAC